MGKLSKADMAMAEELYTTTPEGRRRLAFHSIKYFASYYLGTPLRPQQSTWITFLQKTRRGLVLAPVKHGKTYAVNVALLRKICFNRNIRILPISGSSDHAEKIVGWLGGHLRENPRIIEDFGLFYDRSVATKWTQTKIRVIRPSVLTGDEGAVLLENTVEAIGSTGEKTGARFDMIVPDDLVTEKNVRTETPRNHLRDIMFGTIYKRLDKGGIIWAIGTRKAPLDHWSDILKKKAIWTVHIDKAILEEPGDYEIVELEEPAIREDGTEQTHAVKFKGSHGKVLDPDTMPMEELLLERYENFRLFQREYQNEIVSDESAIFRLEWLEACRDDNYSYVDFNISFDKNGKLIQTGSETVPQDKYIRILAGTDPSVVTDKKSAEDHDTSYMVTFVIGLYENGNFDILYTFRSRGLSPTQKLEIAIAINNRFDPYRHFWESNSAGAMDISYIVEKSGVRIAKHHTGSNKNDAYVGVSAMSSKFEWKKVRFAYKTDRDKQITDRIINEFYEFPNGEHDDQVMAMWITEAGVKRALSEWNILKKRGRA